MARAAISAGVAAAFSYAGSDNTGKEMTALCKEVKAAKKAINTNVTHPTAKKAATKAAGKYTRKVKSNLFSSLKQSIASNAGTKVTSMLYQGAYMYYTK